MMTVRNEIKAQIVRAGYTMQEVVDRLHEEYDWSDSVSNLSAKLQRESIRYKEVVELADVLGYDIIWQKRRDRVEKATQESTLKQLADAKLRRDYADAVAILDRIPKEVLDVYARGGHGRKEQPIEQNL